MIPIRPICVRCGNEDPHLFESKGYSQNRTKRKFLCKKCGHYPSFPVEGNEPSTMPNSGSYSFTNNGETSQVEFTTEKRIRNEQDLIEVLDLDTTTWQIDRFVVGKNDAYRKDRSVEWQVTNGVVVNGEVHDSGRLLVEPLFSVKVWLKRRTQEIRTALAIEDIKKDLAKFAHKYPKIHYPKLKDGLLLELELPDVHLGKMTWAEETGEDSDLKSQRAVVLQVLGGLLSHAKHYPVSKILLPFGHDYFNVDSKFDTTTGGTPQQEDTRWKKTYRAGRILAQTMIEMCSSIAPVEVLMVPGNHDEQRNFYLGDCLEAVYSKNPNVHIDNSAKMRKYYCFGKTLLGFTHGNEEKSNRLAGIMAIEVPELWARTKFREWHVGDKHHKVDMFYKSNEDAGVTVRILRSLTPTDAWHYSKGFIGALRASEAFLWDAHKGLVAQFTEAV